MDFLAIEKLPFFHATFVFYNLEGQTMGSYVANNLIDGEEVLHEAKLHGIMF